MKKEKDMTSVDWWILLDSMVIFSKNGRRNGISIQEALIDEVIDCTVVSRRGEDIYFDNRSKLDVDFDDPIVDWHLNSATDVDSIYEKLLDKKVVQIAISHEEVLLVASHQDSIVQSPVTKIIPIGPDCFIKTESGSYLLIGRQFYRKEATA